MTAIHLASAREKAAGLGAIHFLEKPFPHQDFVDLVGALLQSSAEPEAEKFQGTLSDLHIADIIQLKCMSGASSALEFTGPSGEKARVFFDHGQVRHAVAPGKEGVAAFNEIVNWKGGMISEVSGAGEPKRTIDLDWQMLLMDAVRKIDEGAAEGSAGKSSAAMTKDKRKVLVIDDSLMLLSFVQEILTEASYEVTTAPTAEEGLKVAASEHPHLILLDYVLPDMRGDEVVRRLSDVAATANIPVVYMSGLGADLPPDQDASPSVIGALNKPFTSDLLVKTVAGYMPKDPSEASPATKEPEPQPALVAEQPASPKSEPVISESLAEPQSEVGLHSAVTPGVATGGAADDAWWSAPGPRTSPNESHGSAMASDSFQPDYASQPAVGSNIDDSPAAPFIGTFFSGDTSFFSLNWALHTIAKQKLTGTLRAFWDRETVELLAKSGRIILVTTRDPELYCPEAPITLVNVDTARTAEAREQQRETGCPLFITLARAELILREPAQQLVQHYGQKLFAQLWTAARVRFSFEQSEALPDFTSDVPVEEDVDHWALATLRFIQFQELGRDALLDPTCVPAYTREGYERVQNLRLTVAEAQFASQFNGVRSIAQIAKNLRLDLKFARLTLFRFLALEIVECWPATTAAAPEKRGVFQRLGKTMGLGD